MGQALGLTAGAFVGLSLYALITRKDFNFLSGFLVTGFFVLMGAILLNWTDKRWPDIQEALIGILFVLAASSSILLLANNPHGGEHLKELLIGQILWVNISDLLPVTLLSAIILGLWFGARDKLGRVGFYLSFAVIITASVQLVGVYLVFASLVIPAIATIHMKKGPRLLWGYGIGAFGYGLGLVLSSVFDLPSGSLIVLALAVISCIIFIGNQRTQEGTVSISI